MNPGMLLAPEGIVTSDCNHRGSAVMKGHAWLLLHATVVVESCVGVRLQNWAFGGQFNFQGFLETVVRYDDKSMNLAVCVSLANDA